MTLEEILAKLERLMMDPLAPRQGLDQLDFSQAGKPGEATEPPT